MYHIFFNLSSVDGHLGCFPILAMVNSGAVNTEVHVFFSKNFFFFSFPDICPGVGLLGHMITLFIVF